MDIHKDIVNHKIEQILKYLPVDFVENVFTLYGSKHITKIYDEYYGIDFSSKQANGNYSILHKLLSEGEKFDAIDIDSPVNIHTIFPHVFSLLKPDKYTFLFLTLPLAERLTLTDIEKENFKTYFGAPVPSIVDMVDNIHKYAGMNRLELKFINGVSFVDNTSRMLFMLVPYDLLNKFNNEYIKEDFIDKLQKALSETGSELLSKYVNVRTPITVKCGNCGEEHTSNCRPTLNLKGLCKECHKKLNPRKGVAEDTRKATQKISVETARDKLRFGSTLIEFAGTKKHVKIHCGLCNKDTSAQWNTIKNTGVCGKCSKRALGIFSATAWLEDLGCRYLDSQCRDDGSLYDIDFICWCGCEGSFTWKNRNKDTFSGCNDCRVSKIHLGYKKLVKRFEKHGFKVLTTENEYKGSTHLTHVICPCGRKGNVTLKSVERGRLCPGCKIERTQRTAEERYGVKCVLTLPENLDKSRKTNKERYGFEYPLQSKTIYKKAIKTAAKSKIYKFKDGGTIEIQGFEMYLIKYLEKKGYGSRHMSVDITPITYVYDKERMYNPDLLLTGNKGKKTLFEVKSTWSYLKHREQNLAKWDAAVTQGHRLFIAFYIKGGKCLFFKKWKKGANIEVHNEGKSDCEVKFTPS